jgi:hypothetical protein
MERTHDEVQAKALMKEGLVELLQEKHTWFFHMVVDASEAVGLANAIRKVRQSNLVDETQIAAIFEGPACSQLLKRVFCGIFDVLASFIINKI